MTPNPETMTVQECRDWVAMAYGWTKHDDGWRHPPAERSPRGWDQRSTKGYWASHPLGSTLDSAAAAMPSGCRLSWMTTQPNGRVRVKSKNHLGNFELVADTELLARWRLVVACMLAEKEVGDE